MSAVMCIVPEEDSAKKEVNASPVISVLIPTLKTIKPPDQVFIPQYVLRRSCFQSFQAFSAAFSSDLFMTDHHA